MKQNKRKIIFPSYSDISKKVSQEQTKQYRTKLNAINSKIQKLQQQTSIEEQHRQLAKKLINEYKKQHMFEKTNKYQYDDLVIYENERPTKYANSLNQYLENSDAQQNNYQSHLKFRKKALQRQLEADQNSLIKSHHPKTHKNNNEQKFYKNLYLQNNMKNGSGQSKQNQTHENRCSTLAQNRKKLVQQYMPYMKQLAYTNIVKWRILN